MNRVLINLGCYCSLSALSVATTGCGATFFTNQSVSKTSADEYSDTAIFRGGCEARRRAPRIWSVRCTTTQDGFGVADDVAGGADRYGTAVCKNEGSQGKVVVDTRVNQSHNLSALDYTMVVRCE